MRRNRGDVSIDRQCTLVQRYRDDEEVRLKLLSRKRLLDLFAKAGCSTVTSIRCDQ